MIERAVQVLAVLFALALPFMAVGMVLAYATEFIVAKVVKTAPCMGCAIGRVPIVGPWYARRRQHAYCAFCMPELYR
jgi:hypothetical protein